MPIMIFFSYNLKQRGIMARKKGYHSIKTGRLPCELQAMFDLYNLSIEDMAILFNLRWETKKGENFLIAPIDRFNVQVWDFLHIPISVLRNPYTEVWPAFKKYKVNVYNAQHARFMLSGHYWGKPYAQVTSLKSYYPHINIYSNPLDMWRNTNTMHIQTMDKLQMTSQKHVCLLGDFDLDQQEAISMFWKGQDIQLKVFNDATQVWAEDMKKKLDKLGAFNDVQLNTN
jgi:hypothetical protein